MLDKFLANNKVFIIAEIGKNFIQTKEERSIEEYLQNAKELIKAAKEAGADAVKFQTHNVEDEQLDIEIISPHFQGASRYQWVKRNTEITPLEFWQEIKRYADELDIVFFSTPMSRGAAMKLEKIDVPLWKVGSGDVLDFVLLDYIAQTGKPIIISSGMSRLDEIDKAIKFLRQRNENIALLHCVSKYPAEPEDLNLNTIKFFQKRYNLPIGFSDHSLGYQSAVAAVNLGAKIIEKHFSLSRDFWGADHKVSMLPGEFKEMVEKIRKGEKIELDNYGREAKILLAEEDVFRPIFRKTLVAGCDIKEGEIITPDKVFAVRPQKHIKGLPSEEYENIIGKPAARDFKKFEPFTAEGVKGAKKRRICFVITSKIHYSRNRLILEELRKRDDVELQIVIGASAILDKYGDVSKNLEEEGFGYDAKITMTLEGGNPVAMAKTTGIGIAEFATVFDNLEPDIVVVRGDRYEVLAAAVAASYLNIPVAHIEGGDVTGTIDESVRHAITKLSHIHFVTNEKAKERVLRMGENPEYVFNFGSPELEFVAKNNYQASNQLINYLGVGDIINIDEPFIMVMQHPVTSEFGFNREHITETLFAVYELGIPTIWFWPNVDAGTDEISKGIRAFRERKNPNNIRFIKYLPPEEFIGLLKKTSCLVGNSSSGIKECSFLGVPVVNIGTRQNGRKRAENVIDVGYNREEIKKAIRKQLDHGPYPPSYIYYQENTSKKIANVLATVKLYIQKRFYD